MEKLTDEQVVFFNKLREELNTQSSEYSYNIVHQMNIKPHNLYVSTKLTPTALSGVMAYIEHVAFDILYDYGYSIGESEVIEIVDKFYAGITYLEGKPQSKYYEIDLYFNWEHNAGFPYELGIPELHRDGLLEYIKEMSIRNNWKEIGVN